MAKLTDLVEARRFDIYDDPMPTLAALQSYASNTAGTIFDCATRILGETSEENAVEAGQVQMIANVITLLPRHAARRQLFLPLDMDRPRHAAARFVRAGAVSAPDGQARVSEPDHPGFSAVRGGFAD